MACPQAETVDGFELQIGTNHVGHFLLTQLLDPLLGDGSRVVALSSAGHRFSDVDLDDPNFERTPYDPWGRVRAVEDRERAVRGRARPAPARRGARTRTRCTRAGSSPSSAGTSPRRRWR